MLVVPEPGRGFVRNKHSTDAKPLSHLRVIMSIHIHPEVSYAPMWVRVVVLNGVYTLALNPKAYSLKPKPGCSE